VDDTGAQCKHIATFHSPVHFTFVTSSSNGVNYRGTEAHEGSGESRPVSLFTPIMTNS
jgi:hypothetical protein